MNTKEIGKTLEKQLELLSERAEKSIETDEEIYYIIKGAALVAHSR